jgi:diadenosine tetraphosphate (Ap4A) HIT family hydrolase
VHNEHIKDVTELPLDSWEGESKEIITLSNIIKEIYNCDLINVASLGNHVGHLHWHIIPRYKSEINWGSPPWPHERKEIPLEDCKPIADRIKQVLAQNKLFKPFIEEVHNG